MARYLHNKEAMYGDLEINLLASRADWDWPDALREIFWPRGINLLVADSASDFLNIISQKRIHTVIFDADSEKKDGLATVKIVRMGYPLLPFILLANTADEEVLSSALRLDISGVVNKPVDMNVLRVLLNRIFIKKYDSDIFAG